MLDAKHGRKERDEVNKVFWGSPIIAPPELYGAWIEVTYSPVMGEGMSLDISMPSEGEGWKIPYDEVDKACRLLVGNDLGENIFLNLLRDVGWCTPFHIKICDKGYFHLVLWNDCKNPDWDDSLPEDDDQDWTLDEYSKIRTGDMILRKVQE